MAVFNHSVLPSTAVVMEKTLIEDCGINRGRGLKSKCVIPIGEVLFEESPLVCCQFSWNKLYGYLACDHCLCPLESAEENARRLTNNPHLTIPYKDLGSLSLSPSYCQACGTKYCSVDCLNSALSLYHRLLCPGSLPEVVTSSLEVVDDLWRQSHYPPETGTIMLLVRIVAIALCSYLYKSEDCVVIMNKLQSFVSAVTEPSQTPFGEQFVSHKLLRPEFADSITRLHTAFSTFLLHLVSQFASDSVNPSSILTQCSLNNLLTLDGFRSALCLLGRNGQGIATSAFSLWAREIDRLVESKLDPEQGAFINSALEDIYERMNDHVGTFLDNEGLGLYAHHRFLNHSCSPNALVKFSGANSRLSVISTREINANEEITISYLDECELSRSRHTRRKILASNYLFWCECPRCESERLVEGYESLTSADEDEGSDDSMDVSGGT